MQEKHILLIVYNTKIILHSYTSIQYCNNKQLTMLVKVFNYKYRSFLNFFDICFVKSLWFTTLQNKSKQSLEPLMKRRESI